MALRILLAFDKFKGSLTSREVAEAFSLGICDVMPDATIDTVPIADGGDGILTTLVDTLGGDYHTATVQGPLHSDVVARWGSLADHHTAVVEMAEAAGLRLVEAHQRNPLRMSTYGVGEVVLHALDAGYRRVIIGLGGSATNDGGMGMLQALGVEFYDADNKVLTASGEAMCRVRRVDASGLDARLRDVDIVVASDVDNPLFGQRGAARVYAPQKGASPGEVELLDQGLRDYHQVVMRAVGCDYSESRGAGAAGGVGYALIAFLGAHIESGVELVLSLVDFERRARGCDLIVTGEGRLDYQTLMGKAPSGVLAVGKRLGINVIAIGGGVEDSEALVEGGFWRVYATKPEDMSLEEAMKRETAQQNIRRAAGHIISDYLSIVSL